MVPKMCLRICFGFGQFFINFFCSTLLLPAPLCSRAAPEPLRSCSGAAPPFLPSNLMTLGVLLRSSSTFAPLTMNFRRGKGAAPEPDEEQPP